MSSLRRRLRPLLSERTAFWIQASVLVVLMAASSAPSPLYPLYQAMWAFPPVVLTVIFAAYVLALLVALLVAGSLSDHLGRRPVLLAALALELVAMLVFIGADGPAALILARLLQGLATGAAVGTLGAYLIDLEHAVRPGLGTVFNGAGPGLGLALGAVGSSLLVAAAPGSVQLVYVVLGAVLALQLVATVLGPETTAREPGALASLVPKVRFPRATRRTALWVLPAAVATWSLGGLILSLGPSLVRSLAGPQAVLLTGLVVAALTGTGGVATLLLGSARPSAVLGLGMAALIAGMGGTVAALALGSTGLYFAATVVAGVGFGAGFLAVLRILMPQAAPHERAGLLSAVYVVSYLANSVPAVAAGALAQGIGLTPTAMGYCGMIVVLALVVLAGSAVRARTPAAAEASGAPGARLPQAASAEGPRAHRP
ncbi:MFS transporter [Sinomonas atrocyanea]|uniref:MFS transporter n=1 Tax=Sinomonas atrocyanea TaxID=37927 RepID=UPI002781B656|nr:MFS transporter [Sinomonas atrocyanea]MDQ0260793.1 putative MFS family arabinose efflux permease [Sinomonas atrocyanea]MDR6622224.1 putative MFS family arabinose efflux permease [Sinomonas atrocyanea]